MLNVIEICWYCDPYSYGSMTKSSTAFYLHGLLKGTIVKVE